MMIEYAEHLSGIGFPQPYCFIGTGGRYKLAIRTEDQGAYSVSVSALNHQLRFLNGRWLQSHLRRFGTFFYGRLLTLRFLHAEDGARDHKKRNDRQDKKPAYRKV